MKNVFAIGTERDGTHRHAQCVISILDSWRDARCRVPNFGTCRRMSFQLLVTSMAALFTARLKMQKQEPGRENGGSNIEATGVIPNNVRVLHRARRTRSLGNQV